MNQNISNSNWKQLLGFRNLQEKLKNLLYDRTENIFLSTLEALIHGFHRILPGRLIVVVRVVLVLLMRNHTVIVSPLLGMGVTLHVLLGVPRLMPLRHGIESRRWWIPIPVIIWQWSLLQNIVLSARQARQGHTIVRLGLVNEYKMLITLNSSQN